MNAWKERQAKAWLEYLSSINVVKPVSKSPQASKTGQRLSKSAEKRPKALKRDEVQALGVSVHPVMSYDNTSTIGVQYRVAPRTGVRVITNTEPDGTTYITIYTPSNATGLD